MSVIEYVPYAQSLRIIILEVVKVAHYLSIDSHHAHMTSRHSIDETMYVDAMAMYVQIKHN